MWLYITGDELIDPVALTFEECVSRGYEVDSTPPRVCTTPEGITFTEGNPVMENETSEPTSTSTEGGVASSSKEMLPPSLPPPNFVP